MGRLRCGLALVFLCCATNRLWAADAPAPIRWEPFEIHSYDGRTSPAQLGHLRVPERRDRPNGRTIEFAFLKLPSTATKPADPVVFLMGGPGVPGSAMAPIPPYFTLFERLRALSDVIVLDQRGLGHSNPVLECAADSSLPIDVFLTHRKLVEALAARTFACAASWRAQGIDPCAYNTAESADDLEAAHSARGDRTCLDSATARGSPR